MLLLGRQPVLFSDNNLQHLLGACHVPGIVLRTFQDLIEFLTTKPPGKLLSTVQQLSNLPKAPWQVSGGATKRTQVCGILEASKSH